MYNQLRANVRNYMVPMTIAEAEAYIASLDHAETKSYAVEFLADLEADFNGCETPGL